MDAIKGTIRRVTLGVMVATIAGTVLTGGILRWEGHALRLLNPQGAAADSAGNVYFADT